MYYVYLLRSQEYQNQTYIGLTENLQKRLISHNEGANKHTSKYRPWDIVCYLAFPERRKAAEFERYLKVGSGHAFARKHFW